MSKVLITGASGFLGTKLFDMYAPKHDVLGTFHGNVREGLVSLDVTNAFQTHELFTSFRPDIVIHTVALSDPDICEQRKDDAERINYIGTKNIVDACREIGARLDYISTVYVFDGVNGHYAEDDIPNPINWYGKTKLRAEQQAATLSEFGIYRFDKLYGYNGEGKPNDAFSKIAAGKPFEVNSDQVRQPLFVDDVGRALQLVQENGLNGIFHLAGPDRMSKYELTMELARLSGKEYLVVPIPEREQLARRPRDASIAANKIEGSGMIFTSLSEALPIIEGEMKSETIEGQRKHIERQC